MILRIIFRLKPHFFTNTFCTNPYLSFLDQKPLNFGKFLHFCWKLQKKHRNAVNSYLCLFAFRKYSSTFHLVLNRVFLVYSYFHSLEMHSRRCETKENSALEKRSNFILFSAKFIQQSKTVVSFNLQVSNWFANARRRLKNVVQEQVCDIFKLDTHFFKTSRKDIK